MMLNGMRVVRSDALTQIVEDWSGVRSPARARRRRRQGHPQRISYVKRDMAHAYLMDGTLFVGPDTYDRLLKGDFVTRSPAMEGGR